MSADILQRVGQAVRRAREHRGLSRRALSELSGLSVRFLAELEAGRGNISVRRLDALAGALQVSPSALLAEEGGPSAPRIALLGLRGAGKSTVGSLLAQRLGVPFVELDARIEAGAGLTIAEIFEFHGERHFRRLERETLRQLLGDPGPFVLATGGGLVTEPETLSLLRDGTRTIWLRALPEQHYERVLAQGDERPMAGNPHAMAELRGLLALRQPLYEQADLTVDTVTAGVEDVVERILERVLPEGP